MRLCPGRNALRRARGVVHCRAGAVTKLDLRNGPSSAKRHFVPHRVRDKKSIAMSDLIDTFTQRGDLAHLALLLWASAASCAAWFALRELASAARRFDDFVRELEHFNRRADRRHQHDLRHDRN